MFMTLLGLIVNVIISYWAHSSFPEWLDSFLELVGGAYAPCALFNIGLFMVGKLSKVTGYTIFVSALLIAAKRLGSAFNFPFGMPEGTQISAFR